jgi:hypothetical protein
MKVRCVKCIRCGDIIYSRATHDFRSCGCGYTSIDGGQDYTKVSCEDLTSVETLEVKLPGITKEILYDDWNFRIDRYGTLITRRYNEKEVLCHIRKVE